MYHVIAYYHWLQPYKPRVTGSSPVPPTIIHNNSLTKRAHPVANSLASVPFSCALQNILHKLKALNGCLNASHGGLFVFLDGTMPLNVVVGQCLQPGLPYKPEVTSLSSFYFFILYKEKALFGCAIYVHAKEGFSALFNHEFTKNGETQLCVVVGLCLQSDDASCIINSRSQEICPGKN